MNHHAARWSVARTLSSVGLALLAASHLGAVRQAPSGPAQSPQPTGTGRVSVRVVAADNGAAVKRARVTLSGIIAPLRPASGTPTATVAVESQTVGGGVVGGPPGLPGRTVRHEGETDDTGACTFTQLPAAMYSVMVMPQGGFVRPTGMPQQVRLEDGESQTLTVRLARTGAIVGRVTDDSGEPLMRVQVRALRRESRRGPLSMGNAATTDDLGQFRLFDLQPGEYLVSADLMSFMPPTASRIGFAPTYYPGTAALDSARVVTVRPAQDTAGIEFSLVRAALGTVSGMALDSHGDPLVGGPGAAANVQLSPRGHFYSMGRGGMVQKDGTFVVRNVPPGDYYLSASLYRGQGPQAYREGAFVPVTVNGDDVTVDIRTNTGATVSGRVVFEGEPPPGRPGVALLNGAPAPRVSVYARPQVTGAQPPGMGFNAGPVAVRDDDTFELSGLRGSVLLTASAGSAVFKAILRAGEDVSGKPLELNGTERIDDVVIVLSYETGTLEGVVVDSKGGPPPERTSAVVFPDDPTRWFEGSPFIRVVSVMTEANLRQTLRPSATPSAPGASPRPLTPAAEALRWTPVAGGFFLPRLLPGRYLVAAVDPGVSQLSFDAEALEEIKARAVAVTVNAAQRSKVQVKAPAPDSRRP